VDSLFQSPERASLRGQRSRYRGSGSLKTAPYVGTSGPSETFGTLAPAKAPIHSWCLTFMTAPYANS